MTIAYWTAQKKLAKDRKALAKVLDGIVSSGHLLMGRELSGFESQWANWNKVSYASGLSSGLDAIHLALRAVGVKEGDEVIVPSNTYIATWIGVSMCGAIPVPVEPDRQTACIEPEAIGKSITRKTKAIVPTHLYGHPCPMDGIDKLAKAKKLKVVADGAQGHGSFVKGMPIAQFGDAVAWSFYPTKNLGALGDAGAVTTNNAQLIKSVNLWRNYGSELRYVNEVVGRNNRMEELQAGFLSYRLKSLDKDLEKREFLALRYQEGLEDLEACGLRLPTQARWAKHAWHIYQVQHPKRDSLQKFLSDCGIGTLIHYPIAPHLQKAYSFLGYQAGDFPIAEEIHRQTLSLPLYPEMTWLQQKAVIKAIRDIVKKGLL